MSINRIVVTGNLTRDPELRRTQSGNCILDFGIAINDRRRNPQTGEWDDYANFIDCTMFGNRAESLSEILSKGMKVAIEGRIRWEQWERDGQKRSRHKIIVNEIDLMVARKAAGDSREGGKDGEAGNAGAPSGGNYPVPDFEEVEDVYEDDVVY